MTKQLILGPDNMLFRSLQVTYLYYIGIIWPKSNIFHVHLLEQRMNTKKNNTITDTQSQLFTSK